MKYVTIITENQVELEFTDATVSLYEKTIREIDYKYDTEDYYIDVQDVEVDIDESAIEKLKREGISEEDIKAYFEANISEILDEYEEEDYVQLDMSVIDFVNEQ